MDAWTGKPVHPTALIPVIRFVAVNAPGNRRVDGFPVHAFNKL